AATPTFASQTLSSTTNQLVLGTTNTTTISSVAPGANRTATIPALSASDTFAFLNQSQTLTNKTIGSTGLTFSGASADITTTSNNNLTVAPNGSGQIILSNVTQVPNISATSGSTALCRNASNQI